MNASNTKLTKDEKQLLCEMKKGYPNLEFADNGRNIVCAYMNQGSGLVRFAFAVTSPGEVKFRRKVGQFLAMHRVLPDCGNEFAFLPVNEFLQMLDAIGV